MKMSLPGRFPFKTAKVLSLLLMGLGMGSLLWLHATPLPSGLQPQRPALENCQVHQKSLVNGWGWAVGGLIFLPKKYQKALTKKFPHSELVKYTGCSGGSDFPTLVQFCVACRQAEIEWLRKRKEPIMLPKDFWWATF